LGDTPVQFDTYEAAAEELAEFLSELAYAVKQGFVTDFDNSAYRIKKV
jgi:predicted lipase